MLEAYRPQNVLKYFEEITKIPHCSSENVLISNYLVNFANDRGLEVHQDKALNVLIKKPASTGYEDHPAVILQGHMDMVCLKADGLLFDFNKNPLPIVVEGDILKTKGTTLGADNGIAVAMMLAILDESSLKHPALECLITTDEEIGLLGAAEVDGSLFKGKVLINIDSEEEGIFTTGCAGGVRNFLRLPVDFQDNTQAHTYLIQISGLLGGHSGIEIHKGRANANKLMGRLLDSLDLNIVEVNGGDKMNAIAKSCSAVVTSDQEISVEGWNDTFRAEFGVSDPGIQVFAEKIASAEKTMTDASTSNVIDLMTLIPFGVQAMSQFIPGLVETSTNFGVLSTEDEIVSFESSHRSSVTSKKQELMRLFERLSVAYGAELEALGDYPGWEYEPVSALRELFHTVYTEQTGKKAEEMVIHAGLECGILQNRIGRLDMISIGPEMHDVHTPMERLSLASTERTYKLLTAVLERL